MNIKCKWIKREEILIEITNHGGYNFMTEMDR